MNQYFNKHPRHFRRRGPLCSQWLGILLWLQGYRGLGVSGVSGLTASPPNLQGQQPVVVGDSVLSGREEARIDSHIIFVPVETQWPVARSVVLSRKDSEPLSRPGFQPQLWAASSPM